MNHYVVLICIMLGCGILGGFINFYRLIDNFSKEKIRNEFIKSLLTGIGAAGLVPLLLKMMSSNLLISSATNTDDYFVICGFCLVSSIFSTKFIDSIGDKILNQIDKVSDDVSAVKEELIVISTEAEIGNDQVLTDELSKLDHKEVEVIDAIYDSKYTYRSINGISKDSNLTREEVQDKLIRLKVKGLVTDISKKDSPQRWALTENGRKLMVNYRYRESESF